jgi:hypothetical protein
MSKNIPQIIEPDVGGRPTIMTEEIVQKLEEVLHNY